MVDRQDFINVVCDKCGSKFQEQIARLQETHLFACPTSGGSALLETDLNKLDKFLLEEAQNELASLRLYEIER